jgi:hypothetical protein
VRAVVRRRVFPDTDEQRGLPRFGSQPPEDADLCVVCADPVLAPGGRLQVMCGTCAVRMGSAMERFRVPGWPERGAW